MAAQAFGDEHTRKKLEIVEKYLSAFTAALKKQSFTLLYVDACAGSGSSIPRFALAGPQTSEFQSGLLQDTEPVVDTDQIIVGSAIRALGVQPPFDRYLFNDVKPSNVLALRKRVKDDFGHLEDRVAITRFEPHIDRAEPRFSGERFDTESGILLDLGKGAGESVIQWRY